MHTNITRIYLLCVFFAAGGAILAGVLGGITWYASVAFAIVVSLAIVALFAIRNPIHGLVILLIGIFPVFYLGYNGGQIPGSPFGATILIREGGLFFVVGIGLLWILATKPTLPKSRLTLLIVVFMGWAIFRGLFSSTGTLGLISMRLSIQYIFLYFLVSMSVRTERHIRFFLWTLVLTSVIPVLYNLFNVGDIIVNLVNSPVEQFGRMYSNRLGFLGQIEKEANSANTFGSYLGIVIICIASLLSFDRYSSDHRFTQIFLIGYGFLAGILLIMTFSRRAWLAVIIAGSLIAIKKGVSWWTILIPILVGLLFYLILPQQISAWVYVRLFSVSSAYDENVASALRYSEWRYIIDNSTRSIRSFLFGEGYGLIGAIIKSRDIETAEFIQGHNYYLFTLYQLGIIGLGMFLSIIIEGFSQFRRLIVGSYSGTVTAAIFTVLGTAIMLCMSAFAGNTFEAYPLNLLFWTTLGILPVLSSTNLSAHASTKQFKFHLGLKSLLNTESTV